MALYFEGYGNLNVSSVGAEMFEQIRDKVIYPYDNSLFINLSKGLYYKIGCYESLYEKLKSKASKIGEGLYKFNFGEYPQGKLTDNENKRLLKIYNKKPFMMTGRVYNILGFNYFELEYEGKRYIKYNEEFVEVLPIEWIIYDRIKKIFSYRVLNQERGYGLLPMEEEMTQELYNGNSEEFNISNKVLTIENGRLVGYYNLKNRESYYFTYSIKDTFCVPYGVIAIDNVDLSCVGDLTISSTVKEFNGRSNGIGLDTLELYDDIQFNWHNKFIVSDKIIIHYSSFNSLEKFMNSFVNYFTEAKKDSKLKKSLRIEFYGPKLNRKEESTISRYTKYKCSFYTDIDYKEKEVFVKKETKDDNREENNSLSDEQKKILFLSEQIYKCCEYYSDSDKRKNEYEELFNNYKEVLEGIIDDFNDPNKSISERRVLVNSVKELYNDFIKLLEQINNSFPLEYFKMIDFLDNCIGIFKFEIKESNNLLLNRLIGYASKICSLGENEQHEVLDKLIIKIVNEKNKIQRHIDNPGDNDLEYDNQDSFESYFNGIVQEDLGYIDDYFEALPTFKDSREEIASIISNTFVESKNEYISFQMDYIKQIRDSINDRVSTSFLLKRYQNKLDEVLRFYSESNMTENNQEYANGLYKIIYSTSDNSDNNVIEDTCLKMELPPIDMKNAILDKVIERLNYTIAGLNILESLIDEEEKISSEINAYMWPIDSKRKK